MVQTRERNTLGATTAKYIFQAQGKQYGNENACKRPLGSQTPDVPQEPHGSLTEMEKYRWPCTWRVLVTKHAGSGEHSVKTLQHAISHNGNEDVATLVIESLDHPRMGGPYYI